ncbi:MAG: response regulator transcription factor [Niastella sp.]|nr:response regulator transcription factor [Niastella sp.]
MSTIRILIAEDHMIVRSGLKMVLASQFSALDIMEVDNTVELLDAIRANDFDLVIMDIFLRDGNSVSLIDLIKTLKPGCRILYFTMLPEDTYGKRLMSMGAAGFLSKKSPDHQVVAAVNEILNNRIFMSKALAERIATSAITDQSLNPFEQLSNREFETMLMLLEGKSPKDIAQELSIQVSTVGTYKIRLFEKLKVSSLIELNKLASAFSII